MRNPSDSLNRINPLQAVALAPWQYDFFITLRWIDAFWPAMPRLGTARMPADEPVRFGQIADLSFAPSALHSVTPGTAHAKPRINVRFFGLFGPNGPLPFHLTEYARHREMHNGDETFARFADMFHHRLLLLFYRAWAQAQPMVGLDRPEHDRFATYVGSLFGLGSAASRGVALANAHAKLHFSGLLSRQTRNADGLANMLAGFLRRTVRVEQFAGCWLTLPEAERTRIGKSRGRRKNPTSQLGGGAVLGSVVWDRQHNFRLHIGPLDASEYESFLPGGTALPRVIDCIEQYLGMEFGWDLRLSLRSDHVQAIQLGRYGQLGWTSWLGMNSRFRHGELTLTPKASAS
jgi:type VI secretion system protein ImpH